MRAVESASNRGGERNWDHGKSDARSGLRNCRAASKGVDEAENALFISASEVGDPSTTVRFSCGSIFEALRTKAVT